VAGLIALLSASPAPAADLDTLFALTAIDRSLVRIEAPIAADLPLIDAHTHLNRDMPAERLVELMDAAGVEAMVLMPRTYPIAGAQATDEQAADYARRYPGRFIPFVAAMRSELAPNGSAWRYAYDERRVLADFSKRLDGGAYFGLGEFILRHYNYFLPSGLSMPEVTVAVDHRFMRGVAALVVGKGIPVLFHAEAEEESAAQAETLIGLRPDAIFVWAHNCGRASAEDTARRLRRFPNLMCDLGDMFNSPRRTGGYGRGGPRSSPFVHLVQDDAGRVLPEMKALLEAFPDRFMIGTDCAHTEWLAFYRSRVNQIRLLLAQLAPRAAIQIGRENAARLFSRALAGR
jgi:hypothetical protein